MMALGFFLLNFLLSLSLFYFSLQAFNSSPIIHSAHRDFFKYAIGLIYLFTTPLILGAIAKLSKKIFYGLLIPIVYIIGKFFQSSALTPIWIMFENNLYKIGSLLIISLIITVVIRSGWKIKPLNINNNWQRMINLLIFLIIFFAVFNPKYKYTYERLSYYGLESFSQFHHINFYLMPINEILGGKTLMVDVFSQYGILSNYINSIALKIIGVSYANFVLFNMLITWIYCCLFFSFLKKITTSYILSIVGIIAYLRLFFFRYPAADWEIYSLPSTTPLRYFFDILVVFFIYQYFNKRLKFFLLVLSGLVVGAFFYNFDFGLSILIAYLLVIFVKLIKMIYQKESFNKIINYFSSFFIPLEIIFFSLMALIIMVTFLRSGSFPNIFNYLYMIYSQTGKPFNTSILLIDYYYFPIVIYVVCYYFLIWVLYKNNRSNNHPELVFLLFYGLIIFVYYVNLSEPNHLWTVIHPAILIFFIMLNRFLRSVNQNSQNWSFPTTFFSVLFFVFILFSFFHTPELFAENVIDKLNFRYSPQTSFYYYWNYPGTDIYLKDNDGLEFQFAANKINQLLGDQKSTVIISRYSPLLYLMTNKTSLINHPNPEYDFYSVEDFYQAVSKIKRIKPEYIFIYSKKYSQYYSQYYQSSINLMELLWNQVKDDYQFQETAGAIDIYRIKKIIGVEL